MKFPLWLCATALVAALPGCKGNTSSSSQSGTSASGLPKLGIEDVKVGKGPAAAVGDSVSMEYRGTFGNGVQFDSNFPVDPAHPDKPPFAFTLTKGKANVIDGWNQGIVGMKVGGERKLSIPWELAYGADGKSPQIPPKTDLYFDVKLLGMVRAGQENNFGVTEVKKGAGPAAKRGDWVTITYKASLLNGMPLEDSSSQPNGTLQFKAGTGEIGGDELVPIQGVVIGVIGMAAGGERILTCPPALAYNPQAHSNKIPPGSVIRFDVTMLRVLDHQGPAMKAPKS